MYHVDQQTMLTSQIEAINKKLEALMFAQSQPATSTATIPGIPCNLCGSVSHDNDNCLGQNISLPIRILIDPPHVQTQGGFRQEKKEPSFQETVMQYIQNSESRFQDIETQLGQITKLLSQGAPGTLPSQPEANPRGEVKSIKLRSIKEVENSNKKR
ncbi:hypothetical protein SESBI_13599 [Sesbania bispinosa]|nr:hypothetical protein SESBI_13599 [Sesbania bispinosa]